MIYVINHGDFEVIRKKRMRLKAEGMNNNASKLIGPAGCDDTAERRRMERGKNAVRATDIKIALLCHG